jgi:hypothetical protein
MFMKSFVSMTFCAFSVVVFMNIFTSAASALSNKVNSFGCIRHEDVIRFLEGKNPDKYRHFVTLVKSGICGSFPQGTKFIQDSKIDIVTPQGYQYSCVIPLDKTVCFWVPFLTLSDE